MNPKPVSRKGKPNKATADVRAAIATFAQANVERMGAWLDQIEDPAKAMDLYLRALEYHIPKLARAEVTGKDGGAVEVNHNLIVKGIG